MSVLRCLKIEGLRAKGFERTIKISTYPSSRCNYSWRGSSSSGWHGIFNGIIQGYFFQSYHQFLQGSSPILSGELSRRFLILVSSGLATKIPKRQEIVFLLVKREWWIIALLWIRRSSKYCRATPGSSPSSKNDCIGIDLSHGSLVLYWEVIASCGYRIEYEINRKQKYMMEMIGTA